MLTSTLNAKRVTRFYVLIYLLLSFSSANASLWCQGAEGHSRLESNPVGKCWTACQPVADELRHNEVTADIGVFWSAQGNDCLDSPVYSSVITPSNRTSPLNKISENDIDPIHLSLIPAPNSGNARFFNLISSSQLPHPQALTALRKVVLLH